MASVSVTQALPVDADAGYAALADLAGYENWLTIHQGWKSELPAADEIKVGTQITEVVSVMGMANKIEWTVTEANPPSSMTIEGTGMAGVKVKFSMSVVPTAAGSDATIDAEFSGTMIVGPIGKAVAKNTQADLETSLGKLAANLG
ncbi:MAG: SRPBCC family protein [Nocardioidaceae bacterium]|nr:SRPBCC family protein [Nocardioidaceae bacterium]MCL2612195.1 SRPBCC family protein [Nocardioidaceae bacterium]